MAIKIGERYKVNMGIVRKHDSMPPYIRLVNSIIKDGEGTVEVVGIKEDIRMAEIASWSMGALVKSAWVPVEALGANAKLFKKNPERDWHAHQQTIYNVLRKRIDNKDDIRYYEGKMDAHKDSVDEEDRRKFEKLKNNPPKGFKWHMSAGGTEAPEGKHGFDAFTDKGRYMISPVSTSGGRYLGYKLYFIDEEGTVGRGLYTDLGIYSRYNEAQGKAKEHYDRLSVMKNPAEFCPERIEDPKKFDRRSLRTVKSGDHRITVGCPKGKYDAKKKMCKVGTRIQRILHPEGERGTCPIGGREVKRNPAEPKLRVWVHVKGEKKGYSGYGEFNEIKEAADFYYKQWPYDLRKDFLAYVGTEDGRVIQALASSRHGISSPPLFPASTAFKTVSDIRAVHKGHWFDRKTMKFFGSKLYPTIYGGKYFITSEQPPHGPRVFSIRAYDQVNDDISTVGQLGQYATLKAAKDAVKDLTLRKNPGYSWHKKEEESALDLAKRSPKSGTAESYYMGSADAHMSSKLKSKTLELNPPAIKMKPDDFEELKKAILAVLEKVPNAYEKYQEMGLSDNHFNWNMLWASKFNTNKLYSYLNDAQIDTALKRITGKTGGTRVHKKNPGAKYHREKSKEFKEMSRTAKSKVGSDILSGYAFAHSDSARASKELGMNPPRGEKAYYVDWSSVFDRGKVGYDVIRIKSAVKRAGGTRIRLGNKFGWSNQPKVIIFNLPSHIDKRDVEKEVGEMLETEWVIVRAKNWGKAKKNPANRTDKLKAKKHRLIIKSLHDAMADCSAGDWHFVATGARTKKEIEKEFKKHLKVNPARPWLKKGTKWYLGVTKTAYVPFYSKVKPTKKRFPKFIVVFGPFKDHKALAFYMQEQQFKTPGTKKKSKLRHNPPTGGRVKIYDEILEIRAKKGEDCPGFPGELFKHPFKGGKAKAAIFGNPDGSITVKGKKPLWNFFKYNK